MIPPLHILRLTFLLIAMSTFAHNSIAQSNIKRDLDIKILIDSAFNECRVNYNNSVKLIESAMELATASGSKQLIKDALYSNAYLNWFNGDHVDALRRSNASLLLATELNDSIKTAQNYSLIGLIYLYTSDYDSALSNFNKALDTYILLSDTARILKNYGFQGIVYNKQGDYVKSKDILLKTVLIKRNYKTYNWTVINIEENEQFSKQYYRESLINSLENLSILGTSPKDSKILRQSYQNVALAYLRLNQGDSALFFFKKSAETAQRLGLDVWWLEYGRAYKQLEIFDSAIYCDKKAIIVSLNTGTRITLGMAYNQMGFAYMGKESYKNAELSFDKALKLHRIMGHKNAQMGIMINISNANIQLGNLPKALIYADSSFSIASAIGSRYGRVEALKKMYSINKLKGDYKKAYEIKQVHDTLLDSLQKGKVQLDLAKLDLYNEVEMSRLEINDLNKQQELSKANLKNRTLVIVIISIIAFFIVLLLLFNFLRTKKLRTLNDELNKQQNLINNQNTELNESNKEKEILLGEIHHRVKNNLQTISSLLSIQQRKLKDPESIKVLEDSKSRVMAMGLIHQHLYQNDSFAEINFKNYTKDLVRVLINTNASCAIDVKCRIPSLKIDLDNAIFFGLIINELAINSIKHAYEGVSKPLLEVSIFEENNKTALLVKDNGEKEHIDFDKSNSFGWKMVNNICDKLEGQLIVDTISGLSVKILFDKSIIEIKSAVA